MKYGMWFDYLGTNLVLDLTKVCDGARRGLNKFFSFSGVGTSAWIKTKVHLTEDYVDYEELNKVEDPSFEWT